MADSGQKWKNSQHCRDHYPWFFEMLMPNYLLEKERIINVSPLIDEINHNEKQQNPITDHVQLNCRETRFI